MRILSRPLTRMVVSVMIVGALGAAPALTLGADKKPTVSAAASKPLKAAQDALTAQDFPGALTHLKEAQDLPAKTDFDQFTIDQMYLFAYLHTNDYANAEKMLEAVIGSPYLDKADVPARVRMLAQINYQLKDYDKSIEYGNRAIKDGDANDDVYTIVDQSYYLKGDYKGALQALSTHIDNMIKNGQTPPEERLTLLMSACIKLNDADCTSHALDRIVSYYPKPVNWQNALYTMIQTPGQNEKVLLQLYRLALDVDVLKRPEDYIEMANLANTQGSPGEAERVLEAGQKKGIFTDAAIKAHATQMLAAAKKQAELDTASLPKIAADAAAAKSGTKDVGLGLAYYSYQQYDKAADALNAGLAKGDVKNEADARLLLGIAQLHAGKKDDALKTFDSVKGDPKLEHLAALWKIRAQHA
jgi:tetratricopeptide (TPR) repeat protein